MDSVYIICFFILLIFQSHVTNIVLKVCRSDIRSYDYDLFDPNFCSNCEKMGYFITCEEVIVVYKYLPSNDQNAHISGNCITSVKAAKEKCSKKCNYHSTYRNDKCLEDCYRSDYKNYYDKSVTIYYGWTTWRRYVCYLDENGFTSNIVELVKNFEKRTLEIIEDVKCTFKELNNNSCEWYLNCLEKKMNCSQDNEKNIGYPLNYGYKYCKKFLKYFDNFNREAQRWTEKTMVCLKKKVSHFYTNKSLNSKNCNDLQTEAFNSHPDCYYENGFCNLLYKEWYNWNFRIWRFDNSFLIGLLKVYEVKDLTTLESMKQIFDTTIHCISWSLNVLVEMIVKILKNPRYLLSVLF